MSAYRVASLVTRRKRAASARNHDPSRCWTAHPEPSRIVSPRAGVSERRVQRCGKLCRVASSKDQRVLFIGTQFSNLCTLWVRVAPAAGPQSAAGGGCSSPEVRCRAPHWHPQGSQCGPAATLHSAEDVPFPPAALPRRNAGSRARRCAHPQWACRRPRALPVAPGGVDDYALPLSCGRCGDDHTVRPGPSPSSPHTLRVHYRFKAQTRSFQLVFLRLERKSVLFEQTNYAKQIDFTTFLSGLPAENAGIHSLSQIHSVHVNDQSYDRFRGNVIQPIPADMRLLFSKGIPYFLLPNLDSVNHCTSKYLFVSILISLLVQWLTESRFGKRK